MMWYMWAGKDDIKFQLVDHISHTEYLPAIRHAFKILLTLPATSRKIIFNLTMSKNLGYGLQCSLKDSVHYAC